MKNVEFKSLAILFFATLLASIVSVADQKILVIHSYHAEFPWVQQYSLALETRLSDFNLELDHRYLDTKRIPQEQYETAARLTWQYYQQSKADYIAIILADDNAFRLLSTEISSIDIPVYFLGLNNNPRKYFKNSSLPANIFGVVERPLFIRNMLLVRELIPNLKSILVLFDDSITSKILLAEDLNANNLANLGIQVRVEMINNIMDWKSAINDANEDIIYIGLYQTLVDENNKNVDAEALLEWTSLNSQKPLFGFWDFAVGENKTAGGLVLNGYEQGSLVADFIVARINGSNHQPRVIQSLHGQLTFSQSMLLKYQLTIPPNLKGQIHWLP